MPLLSKTSWQSDVSPIPQTWKWCRGWWGPSDWCGGSELTPQGPHGLGEGLCHCRGGGVGGSDPGPCDSRGFGY